MTGRCPPSREPENYASPFYNNIIQNGLESAVQHDYAKAVARDTFVNYQERLAGHAIEKEFKADGDPWLVVYVIISLVLILVLTGLLLGLIWAGRNKLEEAARK